MDDIIKQLMLLNKSGFDVIRKRFEILQSISYTQPIGRRQLSVYTGHTEREIRAETEALKNSGLIKIEPSGMLMTVTGYRLLSDLQETIWALSNVSTLENELRNKYQIRLVSVVSGDVDVRSLVRRDIGLCGAMQLRMYMESMKRIALTGHTYVGLVVDAQYPADCGKDVTLYPVRTAQMNKEDTDANSNCSRLGKKSGAQFRLLHLGNSLSLNELEKRYKDEDVKQIISGVENAEMLVCGLTALKKSQLFSTMSVRAKDVLLQSDPCCELLGNFIKSDGKQINNPPLYSLSVDQMAKYDTFMLLGAGKDEYDGLHALVMRFKNIHLITDESTAKRLLDA